MPCLLRNFGLSLPVFGAFLLIASCHNPKPLRPDHPQLADGVAMRDVVFQSAALGREMPYRVLLPEKVEADRKLPAVYLLHGNGDDFRDWSNDANVAQYAAKGLILVMPEGNSSFFMNAVEIPQDKYEDYLTRDLVADVEARFPARTDRAGRAMIGISMGGFAAVKIGLSHPERFVFAGAISPAIDVPERRLNWKRIGKWWTFRRIFGPFGSEERRARDPFVLLRSADPKAVPYFYLTAGEQEPLMEPIQRFAARLRARGIAYEFHTKPGGHDWAEWNMQIPGCFESLMSKLHVASSP
jgi:S-formylglutathione hydrolase FrmB